MNETQVKEKLEQMKKTRKILGIVTLVVAIASMALLIGYNFIGLIYMRSTGGNAYDNGFTFPGWQLIFYGIGRQFIMQYHLFDPNPLTIIGMLGTFICLLVCTLNYNKGKNLSKAVKEFVSAGFLVYSAFVLGFLIVPVAKLAATNADVFPFKSQYIENPETEFYALSTATIIGVFFLVAAAVKIFNGAFLLYQKNFAKKYAKKN